MASHAAKPTAGHAAEPAAGPGGASAEDIRTTGEATTTGWTTAWELLLPAVAAPARSRGRALQEALREAVRSGRLASGTRLPASRALAADLGVSRGLVTEAYEQLTAEGYLRAGRGAGTWVGGAVAVATGAGSRRGAPPRGREDRLTLLPGVPDLSLFPRSAWSAAQRAVLAELPHATLGYPDPRGLPRLRTTVAQMLARRRGVVADPERVVVCSGVSQAMTLLGLVLYAGGQRTVAAEDPGSPEHAELFAHSGMRTVRVPLDEEGPDLGMLRAAGVRTLVATPSHQFPSGLAYSPARRAQLLDWARSVDGLVIEDDYDGDFRYDRAPVGALQGLDPDHVAYTGSVSKSLAPGMRLGWMVVPERLADAVVARKRLMDLGNPALDQETLARFIEHGAYDRHLRRCLRTYRERRNALVEALAEHLPGTEVSGIAAGLHVIAALPPGDTPGPELVERAAEAGLAVRLLDAYTAQAAGDGRVRLVIGYAALAPYRIDEAVRLLARVVANGRQAAPGAR
ncbi:PLP-dependent aminotransferase family protein [Streptomyces indicus]|uniref:GntR family transcriptional regulator / MocR family aminotransferase n=1 Tax=Streptomyces indicus TaxID=417292 RepID=A0A1G9A0U6_9ACTN|nr:PLP-dependent aminotransferase family protein [Streptomyces indicus]SDK20817.1 GntR family transcriptional regulator / MocR family aminotransferase [Streptomyces indicus]